MRYALSFLIMAFSASALLGGYVSGRAAVPKFSPATPSAAKAAALVLPSTVQTDEIPHDEFAGDAAVAVSAPDDDPRNDARLAIVLVDAGRSAALAAPFLELPIRLAVVIDSSERAARGTMQDALQAGDAVYIQAHAPLTASAVQRIHAAFPAACGIALRVIGNAAVSADALAALRRDGLALFDEYGEDRTADARLASNSARFSARSVTVDDHAQQSYVAYMLRQAVQIGRERTAVVMARPFPGTLQAFEDLLAHASRDGVRFVTVR